MEDRLELRKATEAIAAHLDGWKLSNEDGPRDNALYLVGPDDVRVLVSAPWNQKGRVEFSVSLEPGLHNFRPYQDDSPCATVSLDRDPQAAARDIKRRCLDPAVPYVLALRKKKADSDAKDAVRMQVLESLARLCGGEVHGQYNQPANMYKPMECRMTRGEHNSPSVKASLTYGDLEDLETHVYGPDRVNVEINYLSQRDTADLMAWLRFRLWPENGEQGRLL